MQNPDLEDLGNSMKSWGYIEIMKQNQECMRGNQKERVTGKFLRCVVVGLTILTLCLIAQSAKAIPITEISIPMGSAKYNIADHSFVISTYTEVVVFYEGFNMEKYEDSMFALDTKGLDWEVSPDNRTIKYDAHGGAGKINLLDVSDMFNPITLLAGELHGLQMTIVDPIMGVFEGTGNFAVLGGSLASDFGDNGGLATIGITFNVPFDFSDSFTAMANTTLHPKASIPDVTTLVLLGSAMLIGSLFGRKKAF